PRYAAHSTRYLRFWNVLTKSNELGSRPTGTLSIGKKYVGFFPKACHCREAEARLLLLGT
ncbi:MAG: hypothetical protein ACYTEO_14260, partial [Planctomycetota bacterium]